MILGATITGSLTLNGVNLASITGSEASINALNSFTASAATTGSNVFKSNQTVTGSLDITGSLTVVGPITGTVTTASYVLNAVSASYALNATTSSYALNATTASYALASTSASYALNATTASFALVATTASYAANADLLDGRDSLTFANTGSNAFVGTQNINGDVAITGSLTTTGAITAQTLNVQQVTSSIVYSSGSNIFGNSVSNMQSMTGSVGISGSLAVVGASTITGVLTLNSTITNGTYTYTLPSATGTLALTSALTGYLPLTGGTLTGALSGTSATFTGLTVSLTSGNIARFSSAIAALGTTAIGLGYTDGSGGHDMVKIFGQRVNDGSGRSSLILAVNAVDNDQSATVSDAKITISGSTGNITLASALSGTSATFSGNVGITGTTAAILTLNGSAGSTAGMMINPSSSSRAGIVFYQQATVDKWQMGMSAGASPTFDLFTQGASANAISFAYATGAATFSNDVGIGGATTFTAGGSRRLLQVTNGANGGAIALGNSTESGSPRLFGDSKDLGLAAGTTTGTILMYTNDVVRLTIASTGAATFSGNLGVGTNKTSGVLNAAFEVYNNATGAASSTKTRISGGSNGANGGTMDNEYAWNDYGNVDQFNLVARIRGVATSNSGSDVSGKLEFYTKATGGTYLTSPVLALTIASTGQITQSTTISDWSYVMSNSNATSPNGIVIQYTAANKNNTSNPFLYCVDNSGATLRMEIRSNGGIANYSANDVNLSDERTKKDIEPLESYWDKFKAIEIVKFKYKDQTHDDFNIGVIAQQVEAVAPEFVDVDGWDNKPKLDEEGNEIINNEEPLKSIYTADLYHATIKVLQECMSKIESQQSQIEALKLLIK